MNVTFSNARLYATFDDWPSGSERVKCAFQVHKNKCGWRVERSTTNRHGAWCKPKFTTYTSGPAVIVDGSNGKTYLLMHSPGPGMECIRIVSSDLQHDAGEAEIGRRGYVYNEREDADLFKTLLSLIVRSGAVTMPAM